MMHTSLGIHVQAGFECQACGHEVDILDRCPECGSRCFKVDTNISDPKTLKGAIRSHENRGILQHSEDQP